MKLIKIELRPMQNEWARKQPMDGQSAAMERGDFNAAAILRWMRCGIEEAEAVETQPSGHLSDGERERPVIRHCVSFS